MISNFDLFLPFLLYTALFLFVGLVFRSRKIVYIRPIPFDIIMIIAISIPSIVTGIGITMDTQPFFGILPLFLASILLIFILFIYKKNPKGDLFISKIKHTELFSSIRSSLSNNGIAYDECGKEFRFSDEKSRIRIEYGIISKNAKVSFLGFRSLNDIDNMANTMKNTITEEPILEIFSNGLFFIIFSLIEIITCLIMMKLYW